MRDACGLSIIHCWWGLSTLLRRRLNCRGMKCETGNPCSLTKNGVGQRECSFHMMSPLALSSMGVPSRPPMRFASLPRHRGEGVGIKRTRAQKSQRDVEKSAPKLTNGGKLQSKNELNATMPLRFHNLVGRLNVASQ